jgi:hypothetical protein
MARTLTEHAAVSTPGPASAHLHSYRQQLTAFLCRNHGAPVWKSMVVLNIFDHQIGVHQDLRDRS